MSKKIVFQGSAVEKDTREFFLKIAKVAYDDCLNVEIVESRGQSPGMYDAVGQGYVEGALNLSIWKEEEIFISEIKDK